MSSGNGTTSSNVSYQPTKNEANNDSPSHHLAKVVNELTKVEDTGEVQGSSSYEGCIPAGQSVAVIRKPFASEGRNGKTFLLETRQDESDEELEYYKTSVDF